MNADPTREINLSPTPEEADRHKNRYCGTTTGRYHHLTKIERLTMNGWAGGPKVCEDCGAIVFDVPTHDRFHAIANEHARVLAKLTVGHIGTEAAHAAIYDRIQNDPRRNRNNWSAEAFEEVTETLIRGEQP